MIKKLLLITAVTLLFSIGATAQNENILIHEIPYSSHNQSMWGPGGAFNLELDYDLFNIAVQDGFSQSWIENILGSQWGIGVDMGIWMFLRSTFSIHGFTFGSVDVDYPVRITLDFPDHYSFDHGQTVTINSFYEVLPGWALDTHFPTAGIIALDLEYGFGLNFDIIVCAFDCETLPVIPTISIPVNPYSTDPLPHDSIAIFYLNGQTGEVVYPCIDPITGLPNLCEDDVLPIVIPDFFGIGLTGEIDLPYVVTTDAYDPNTQCLTAHGNDEWLWFNLNIMQFLSFIAGFIPPPNGPAIQQAIDFLDGGTINYEILPGVNAVIEYFILHMDLHMSSYMTQDFSFCPTILATLRFATELPYTETDPSNGNQVVQQGTNDTITFIVNNDLNITYPCFGWDSMQVYDVTYHIIPTFTNHTWDSIAFDFILEAIFFQVTIPTGGLFPITTIPSFCLPEIQVDNGDLGMSQTLLYCSNAYETPAVTLEEYLNPIDGTKGGGMQTKDITFCFPTNCEPLISESWPLGYIPLTWFNQTWELQGFIQDTVFPGTWLYPLPELGIEITGQDVLCFGDTSGVISVTALNSSPNYTWEYSWGTVNTHAGPTDQIIVPSGYYYVTLTDTWGCQVFGEMNIADANPPIISNLYADDVLCHGDATGNLYAYVSGGVPPYTFDWQPSGRTEQNPQGVFAGWHYLTITDAVGCEHYDSVFVDQPPLPLMMDYVAGMVSCHGYYDGYIDITASGGTPGYYYYWSNGQLTQDLINIPVGSYTVTIIDAVGCQLVNTIVITEPDPLVLSTYTQNVLCYGENTGSIDLVVQGGTPPYSYQWSNGSASQDLWNIYAGIYVVTVTDSHNCVAYTMVQIQQPALPLHGNITPTHVRCFGEGNGIADLNVFGGTPPYYFTWSNGEISEDIYNLIPDIYYVTINDAHNCLAYDTVQILQPDAPMFGTITGTNASCNGYSDGNIYIQVSGGRPPYTYVWSTGSWQQNLIGVPAGTYYVVATDQSYCHYEMSYTITEPDPFFIQAMDDPTICHGMMTEIGIGIISGSVPPYTIVWSNNDQGMTTTVAPTTTTTYTAHVVDSRNCVSEDVHVTVHVHDSLTMSVAPKKDKVCPGEPNEFEVLITGGGISPNQVYINDSLYNLPIVLSYNRDTVFNFYVEDACGFRNVSLNVPVQVHPLPPVNIMADKTNGCSPLTVQFYELSPDQGQRYIWNFDNWDFENLSFDKNPVNTFYNDRTYHVTLEVISDKGCKRDTSIAITVFTLPEAKFVADRTTVNMSNPVVNFTNLSTGGYYFSWDFSDGTTSTDRNPVYTFKLPGVYRVTLEATTWYGCKDTASLDIYVNNDVTIYAPTAFTPNHDNVNETFKVIADGIDPLSYKMVIYNRWGELVFSSDSYYQEWDGRMGDKDCPEGIYFWQITFLDMFGNEYNRSGNVSLIR